MRSVRFEIKENCELHERDLHSAVFSEGYTTFVSCVLPSGLQLGQSTFYSKPFLPHFRLNLTSWSGFSHQTQLLVSGVGLECD